MRATPLASIIPATLLLTVIACGGGGDSVGPKPNGQDTTHVSNPVATSLVLQSGADQSADPGTTVPIAPVVMVKDASGAAMSGVTVQFAVTSGGGAVQQSSVVTSSAGTATPGTWRLGASEGRNELRVTSGSLTPVTIGANAVFTSHTVSDTTVTSGTITVTTDGPLKGTTLVVPSGAYTGSKRWTLAQQTTTAWPKRANLNFDPIALRITGTATELAKSAMTLTIPTTQVAGQKTFVVMRDVASGGMVVLNTIDQTETSITVSANHFDGTFLTPPSAAPAFMLPKSTAKVHAATGYDAAVVVAKIPVAELDKDYDTGFRPGVDDWDFHPVADAMSDEPVDLGKTFGSLLYFGYLRGRGTLYKRYQLAPNVEYSNRAGIRSSAYMQMILPKDAMFGGLTAIRNSTRAGAADQIFYDVLKANLFVSGLPQMLVAEFKSPAYNGDEDLNYHMKFLTVYRTSGSQLMFADPYRPGDASLSTQFSNGKFATLTIPVGESRTLTADNVDVVAPTMWVKMPLLVPDMNSILDGKWPALIATDTGRVKFPDYKIKVRGDATVRDSSIFLPDTTRMWIECPTCISGLTNPQITAARMEPFIVYKGSTALGTSLRNGLLWDKLESRDEKVGLVVLQTGNADGSKAKWLDWTTLQARQWSLKFTPPAPTGRVDTDIAITANMTGPSTPSRRYAWIFGDNTPVVSTKEVNSVTHKYTTAGTYWVISLVFEDTSTVLLAMDSVAVTVSVPSWAGWRITSLNLAVTDQYRNKLIAPGESDATPWIAFKAQAVSGSIEDTFIKQVALDSTELFGIANGSIQGAVVYLNKDTVTKNRGNVRAYNSTRGMYLVVGNEIPVATQSMAYSLDPFFHQLGSNSTWGGITYQSCDVNWGWAFTATGAPLTGVAAMGGSAWSDLKMYIFPNGEPRRRPSINATVDANGNITGTITMKYRLGIGCPVVPADQVHWTITGTFTGTRIK